MFKMFQKSISSRRERWSCRGCFEMAELIKFTILHPHKVNDVVKKNSLSGNLTTIWLRIKGVLSLIVKLFEPAMEKKISFFLLWHAQKSDRSL